MTTHWGGRDLVGAWKNTLKLFFPFDVWAMTPCYDFQPQGVNWLPEDVKTTQNYSVESQLEGHFLVKRDWKVVNNPTW